MEKQYTVYYSWTIDHISWECPVCDHPNESKDSTDECLVCEKCGFERETSSRWGIGECDGESDDFYYWEPECPNCGAVVENEGDLCENCQEELGCE